MWILISISEQYQ